MLARMCGSTSFDSGVTKSQIAKQARTLGMGSMKAWVARQHSRLSVYRIKERDYHTSNQTGSRARPAARRLQARG